DPAELEGRPRDEVVRRLEAEARAHYARKEAEFPIRVAMTRFFIEGGPGHPARYDREGLIAWLDERYGATLDLDEIRPLRKPEIQERAMALAHEQYRGAELYRELDGLVAPLDDEGPADEAALAALARWGHERLGVETTADELR